MSRDWSTARSFGRTLQGVHLLESAKPSNTSGDDILPLLNVNSVEADAQPKKVTVSGLGAAAAPYVAAASGSARGPLNSVQYNNNGTLQGSENVVFTGSGIYASGVSSPSYTTNLSSINSVTATGYTLLESDNGRTILFTSTSGVALQVPAGLSPGFNCTIIQTTASGRVTLTSGTNVVLNSAYSAFKTTTQYSVAGVIGISSNSYIVTGDITV